MADVFISNYNSGQVTHDLMHVNQDLPAALRVGCHRLHARVDLTPLLRPVRADLLTSTDKTAFERSWPSHVRGH